MNGMILRFCFVLFLTGLVAMDPDPKRRSRLSAQCQHPGLCVGACIFVSCLAVPGYVRVLYVGVGVPCAVFPPCSRARFDTGWGENKLRFPVGMIFDACFCFYPCRLVVFCCFLVCGFGAWCGMVVMVYSRLLPCVAFDA